MPRSSSQDRANEIIAKVEDHYSITQPLRDRFDKDYELYRLSSNLPPDPELHEGSNDGFREYISNEPMTFADKVISWADSAELIIRIRQHDKTRHEREVDLAKEKLAIGFLKQADERLLLLLVPALRQQMAFYIAIRGWYAGRALLRKKEDGSTFVDVTPWDPLHTAWNVGADGLDWACYRTQKTRTEIKAQYGKDIPGRNADSADSEAYTVYDYYDKEINVVIAEGGRILKKWTPHGATSTPVWIGAVGTQPLVLSTAESQRDSIADYGESVFKANRSTYQNFNLIMSVYLELAARARKPPIGVPSQDGTRTLEGSPYNEGATIPYRTGDGPPNVLQMIETTRDAQAVVGIIAGEVQRGSLPHSVYGELAFQLSGYAINVLRQGIDTNLEPRMTAMSQAYSQIIRLLCDQYTSDSFEPLEVSGRPTVGVDRAFFSETIEPSQIKGSCVAEIKLVGKLPQDDMANMTIAQMAREGPTPLFNDRYVLDEVLGVQDSDNMEQAVIAQMAGRGLPEAQLYNLMMAAVDQGQPEIAQLYLGEFQFMMSQKLMMKQQAKMESLGLGATPPQNGMSGGAGPTLDPRVGGAAAVGNSPGPTGIAGPLVPPGAPRPGAPGRAAPDDTTRRLSALGLERGR